MARSFTCPTRVYPGLFSYTKLHRTRSLPISFTRAMHSASMFPALAWNDSLSFADLHEAGFRETRVEQLTGIESDGGRNQVN